jgi:glycosyltransferase involved in cell wall biosynthesis
MIFSGFIASRLFSPPARTEPYGVSVLEAMACGAIVVASDQTAAALDRIDNGVNGFLHASNDVNGLSSRIIQAMEPK